MMPQLFIIGVLGALALFNVLLGVTLCERIYYWYGASTGCFALYEFVACGAAWRWLWPGASLSYTFVIYATYLIYFVCVVMLARDFLDLPRTQRTVWRAILLAFVLGVSAELLYAIVPNLVDRTGLSGYVDAAFSGCLLSTILASGLVAWRRGVVGAGPYSIAFAGVVVGLIAGALGNNELVPRNGWTDAAPGIGVAWEAVFLALALAERIRRLRGERDALELEALVDALTGIANRRAFDRRLIEEWRRGVRGRTQLAAIVIDVDYFKSYNDAHGHVAGDGALKLVASAITRSMRRVDDFVARYGGEEFVVLLPYCNVAAAVAVADAIRAAVQALDIAHAENPSGRMTISAGAAAVVPSEATMPERIVAAADLALYVAKRSGRNRVAESATLIA